KPSACRAASARSDLKAELAPSSHRARRRRSSFHRARGEVELHLAELLGLQAEDLRTRGGGVRPRALQGCHQRHCWAPKRGGDARAPRKEPRRDPEASRGDLMRSMKRRPDQRKERKGPEERDQEERHAERSTLAPLKVDHRLVTAALVVVHRAVAARG